MAFLICLSLFFIMPLCEGFSFSNKSFKKLRRKNNFFLSKTYIRYFLPPMQRYVPFFYFRQCIVIFLTKYIHKNTKYILLKHRLSVGETSSSDLRSPFLEPNLICMATKYMKKYIFLQKGKKSFRSNKFNL